jgi:hypothetical protein
MRPQAGSNQAGSSVRQQQQAMDPLRKHGAVGLILACYTLGLVLLQLVLIRTGGRPVLETC